MIVKCGRASKAIVSSWLMAAMATAMPASSARAELRTTSFATFLHIGPGRQYAVTDEVPTRSTVDVGRCENNWCQIRYGGGSGWLDQRMLATAAPAMAGARPGECFGFARTGWPNAGDHEQVCVQKPAEAAAPPR